MSVIQNKWKTLRAAGLLLLDGVLTHFVGEKCESCGSRDTQYSGNWTRGYNRLCRQAYGDAGTRCNDCGHIHWETPLAEHRRQKPEWCADFGN